MPDGSDAAAYTTDTADSHIVAIYLVEAGLELAVKDRAGTYVTHKVTGNRVRMFAHDGEAVDFVSADDVPEIVENIPVVLDFSNGNQTIQAPEGMAVKSAIIQKPDTLTLRELSVRWWLVVAEMPFIKKGSTHPPATAQ